MMLDSDVREGQTPQRHGATSTVSVPLATPLWRFTIPAWLVIPLIGRILSTWFAIVGQNAQVAPRGYFKGTGPGWLSGFTDFDAEWYLRIAEQGYRVPKATAFFPLYPLMMRLGGSDPVVRAYIGLLISNVSYVGANYFLFRVTYKEFDERVAIYTVAITAFLPFSVIWGAIYTESFAFLLLMAGVWLVRTNRWWRAMPLLIALGFTRNIGLVVSLMLLLEWWKEHRPDKTPQLNNTQRVLRLLSCALPGAATLSFVAWATVRFPNRGGQSVQGAFFHRELGFPWWPILKDLQGPLTWGQATSLSAIFLGIWWCGWKYRHTLRPSSIALVLGVLAMHLVMNRQDYPHTIGAARYVLLTFPFAQSAAMSLSKRGKYVQVLIVGFAVWAVAFSAWTYGQAIFEVG